ncbi:hypothetical protein Asp14428_28520 [Actinoplanes sp. NBRC 14428]|nr:hypothetical protein Asp14428_28520 [Actinoplanes sp. NBRC 14428]
MQLGPQRTRRQRKSRHPPPLRPPLPPHRDPEPDRAPILKEFVTQVPGARPHVPVDRHAPVTAFAAIADRYPAFRVEFEEAPGH